MADVMLADLYGAPRDQDYRNGPHMVLKAIVPGEHIRRYLNVNQLASERKRRRPNGWVFDKERCEAILRDINLARPVFVGAQRTDLDMAVLHMLDAMNEALPMEVREDHYDITGSIVYRTIDYAPNGHLSQAFDQWFLGGGA